MKTKMKTSLTLSREVVRGIDRVAGKKRSRSAVVDDVLRAYLSHRERAAANARDGEKINRFSSELNAEMQDVLAYQSLGHLGEEQWSAEICIDCAIPEAETRSNNG
jgi:metal-responsive CopG/Arc/MetJ family transcriptional regulator